MQLTGQGTWLIAVSTGPDSMALLHMCLEAKIPCAVAHVNYHHRLQAEQEEAYMISYCKEHGIPLHLRNEPFQYTGNFEAAAREWRYAFFRQLVEKYGYCGVLVAHHQDDLIETYLMQKEKHLIPKTYGLAKENDWHGLKVVRPLLDQTKEELIAYCDKNGVRYFLDHTNESEIYKRNAIRNQMKEVLTPEKRREILWEINEKNKKLEELRNKASNYIINKRVDIGQYRSLEEELRLEILRQLLVADNTTNVYSSAHLKEIDGVICKEKDFYITVKDNILVQDFQHMFLIEPVESYEIAFQNRNEMEHYKHTYFHIEPGIPGVYAISLQDEDFPITIRNVQESDKIEMRFGNKKVHRFFIDRHIPLYQRKSWPVVVNAKGTVILVPGLGCDVHHFSIKPDFSVIQYTNSGGSKNDI